MDACVQRRRALGSWVICPKPRANPKVRLFCFPFAGAGASMYHGWHRAFHEEMEVCAVQLPGRESRMREPRITDAIALSQQIADAIEPYLERPFALFGYSLGALLAFETARALRRRGDPLPVQLFVAAMRAPHVPALVPRLARLPRDQFLREVRWHFQPSEDTFNVPELLDLLLPVLRDDMALVDDYAYHAEPPLACAMDAYVGADDRSISVEAAQSWRAHIDGPFALTVFPGGHFFLHEALPDLQRNVATRLHETITDRQ